MTQSIANTIVLWATPYKNIFKDKLQDLIDKKVVELDVDIIPAAINAIFIGEDNETQTIIVPQDVLDNERDEWVTFESKATCRNNL